MAGEHVFFNEGWVNYSERQNYLLEATLGVTTHFNSAETRFSFRTRALDYLWAGLPIVTTEGDSFAELVETEGLGLCVPPEDPDALEDALARLLYDREMADECRVRVAAVRERFRWAKVLEPLAQFCRDPRRAPDIVLPRERIGGIPTGCGGASAGRPPAGDRGGSGRPRARGGGGAGPSRAHTHAGAAGGPAQRAGGSFGSGSHAQPQLR